MTGPDGPGLASLVGIGCVRGRRRAGAGRRLSLQPSWRPGGVQVTTVRLHVVDGNAAAERLYQRHSFLRPGARCQGSQTARPTSRSSDPTTLVRGLEPCTGVVEVTNVLDVARVLPVRCRTQLVRRWRQTSIGRPGRSVREEQVAASYVEPSSKSELDDVGRARAPDEAVAARIGAGSTPSNSVTDYSVAAPCPPCVTPSDTAR